MANYSPEWWYSLIAASPRPEFGERVNIGILFGNGRRARLAYLPRLPRLAPLVGSDELAVFSEMIKALERSVSDGADLALLRQAAGPQLQIGDPRRLYAEPDERVRQLLVRGLLRSRPAKKGSTKYRFHRSATERELDRLIGSIVPATGLRVERRPTLHGLYQPLASRIPEGRSLRFSRALRSQRRDILMDGVMVDAENPLAAIKLATTRVGRAFWYCRKLYTEIQTLTGRQLKLVGVLVNATSRAPEVVEAREYIAHVWSQDADRVIDLGRPADVQILREEVHWLTG